MAKIDRYWINKEEAPIEVIEEKKFKSESYDPEEYKIAISVAKVLQSNEKDLKYMNWSRLCDELKYFLGYTVHPTKVKVFSYTSDRYKFEMNEELRVWLLDKNKDITPLNNFKKWLNRNAQIDIDEITKEVIQNADRILEEHNKAKRVKKEIAKEEWGGSQLDKSKSSTTLEDKHPINISQKPVQPPKFQETTTRIHKKSIFEIAVLFEEWVTRCEKIDVDKITTLKYEKLNYIFCYLLWLNYVWTIAITGKTLEILKKHNPELAKELNTHIVINWYLGKDEQIAKKLELQLDKIIEKNNARIKKLELKHLIEFTKNEYDSKFSWIILTKKSLEIIEKNHEELYLIIIELCKIPNYVKII